MTVSEGRSSTVTLLFIDLEGSTRLLTELGPAYPELLRDYRRIIERAADAHGGSVVDTAGDGLFLSFATARGAVEAALAIQQAMRAHPWPGERMVLARVGIHTGEPLTDEGRLVGLDVHRAARICAAGHGGQILVSATAHQLLGGSAPAEAVVRDLGEHRLKDLPAAERIFQFDPRDLPGEFPPLRSLDNWPNNLPRQLTTFVGREDLLAEALRLLPDSSLLTLVGPGGVGKTRLALEAAARFMDEAPDGAWLVDLAAISDEALVTETVATTLRVAEQPGTPTVEAIGQRLAEKRTLLIFDNCEHVLTEAAAVADHLLHRCRWLRIMATSREPLGFGGEHLLPVGSLAVPAEADPEAVAASEAVRLFADRARAVQPVFELTEGNAAAVGQICRRLDGIPLAIELAAARVKALPPEAIADRLDDRFRLLTGGSRMALPRHRTLRAAVDWSFDLLTDTERSLFVRLSVFAGSFDLPAAEAICGYADIDPLDVLDLLSQLIDRSLVVLEGDGGRYRLLDTIRQYAEERLLETDATGALRIRHRSYYVQWIEQMAPGMFGGPGGSAAESHVRAENENLRAALRWADEDPAGASDQLRLSAAMWGFWTAAGLLEEGRGWLSRATQRTDGEVSTLRAEALTGLGIIAGRQGDLAAAVDAHGQALAIHRQLGSRPGIAFASSNLANVSVEVGDLDRARTLYQESIDTTRAIPDLRAAAFASLNLADVLARQGELAEAFAIADASAAEFRSAGDPMAMALALGRSATFSLQAGDTVGARERHRQAMAVFEQFGDQRGVARSLMFLADIEAVEGNSAAARTMYLDSIRHRQTVGDRGGLATACDRLARLLSNEDPERAASLLGFADRQREASGVSLPAADAAERDQLIAALETALGGSTLARQRATGRRLSLAEVVGDGGA